MKKVNLKNLAEKVLKEDDGEQYEQQEDDCFITDVVRGGYDVSCGGKFISHVDEYDDAIKTIKDWQEKNKWYPNVWFVDDHGGINAINLDDEMIYEVTGNLNRYVATMEFFVWADNDATAKKSADKIAEKLDFTYDNSPKVTNIVAQEFGKLYKDREKK